MQVTLIENQYGKRDIYGNPAYVGSSPNNLSRTRNVFGVFGQMHASATNTGGLSQTTVRWCQGLDVATFNCPNNAAMVTVTETAGAPTTRVYHDQLGREIRSQSQNMEGLWRTTDTWHDILGRTAKQTEPYLRDGNSAVTHPDHITTTVYDALDRVVTISQPAYCVENIDSYQYDPQTAPNCASSGSRVTTTEYLGLTVKTTNPNGQVKVQKMDETGKVERITDANGSFIDYGYDNQGNLVETISYDDQGSPITITMDYDAYGRKTQMSDPDKGTWYYTNNSLGELISQTDANGQTTQNYYDVRGRLFFRKEPGVRSYWEHDTAKEGLMRKEFSLGEYTTDGKAKQVDLVYDAFYRPVATNTRIYDGSLDGGLLTGDNVYYSTSATYDEYGRAFQSFDATGAGVLYQYNDYGYQVITRDAANGFEGQIYHEVKKTDARGNVVHERMYDRFDSFKIYDDATGYLQDIHALSANGYLVQDLNYAFDAIGNLIRRTDLAPPAGGIGTSTLHTETFKYDVLNRLKEEYYNYNAQAEALYVYDDTGNLTQKDGMVLQYNDPKPHAVSAADNQSYAYDNNGNMTQRTGTKPLTITYTAFDKPDYMNNGTWTNHIAYDANRSRYIRVDDNGSDRTLTHYTPGVEFVYKSTGMKAKRYIGNLVIHVEVDSIGAGNLPEIDINRNRWDFNYLLKDHIGSTHQVVGKTGDASARMGFNAWGERRKPPLDSLNSGLNTFEVIPIDTVWTAMGSKIEDTTNRGFTGHEQFDQMGIIHMNGRIYDPFLGRFLQADPIIQDPYDTQSLNRYSYVMNNPLSYTDPTGYVRLRDGWWRTAIRTGIAIGISVYAGKLAAGFVEAGSAAKAIATVSAGGFVSGGVSSGNLRGAVSGGITAYLTFGVAHGFNGAGAENGLGVIHNQHLKGLAHAGISGASAVANGGKFGHGFISAGLTELAYLEGGGVFNSGNAVQDVITNAILQGTISELTGGKFTNGAMSAAFRVAFNHNAENRKENQPKQSDIVVGIDGGGSDELQDNIKIAELVTDLDGTLFNGRAVRFAPVGKVVKHILNELKSNPSGRIYILGYSAGGHTALKVANRLGEKGIPVQGLVTFDAHSGLRPFGFGEYKLQNNVGTVLNFYQHNEVGIKNGNPFLGGVISRCASCASNPNVNLSGTDVVHANIVRRTLRSHREQILNTLGR